MNYQRLLMLTSSCFFCSSLFADSTGASDIFWQQHRSSATNQMKERTQLQPESLLFKSVNLTLQFSNKSAFSFIEPQFHYSGFIQPDMPIQINQTEQDTLPSQITVLALKQGPDFVFENKVFLKTITETMNLYSSIIINEVGFLQSYPRTSSSVKSHVEQLDMISSQKYVLNFDGSRLVYFDLPQAVSSAINKSAASQVKCSSLGTVFIPQSIQNDMIDNSINKKGIREANHITVVDDRIILDTKEIWVNNVPERIHYQKQAVDAIKMRTKAQVSEDLLTITWKPRHRPRSN